MGMLDDISNFFSNPTPSSWDTSGWDSSAPADLGGATTSPLSTPPDVSGTPLGGSGGDGYPIDFGGSGGDITNLSDALGQAAPSEAPTRNVAGGAPAGYQISRDMYGNTVMTPQTPGGDMGSAIKGFLSGNISDTLKNNPKGALGLLSMLSGAAQLLGPKPKQISPTDLSAMVPKSPYNNFTPSNQAIFNGFMSGFKPNQMISGSSGKLIPYGARGPGYAGGGAVHRGQPTRMNPGMLNYIRHMLQQRAAQSAAQGQQMTPAAPQQGVTPPSQQPPMGYAQGGPLRQSSNLVAGQGGGQDDKVDARLSPGEYVMDADAVSALGDGDNNEGARKLDELRESLRAHKRSAPATSIPPKAKSPLAYMKGGKE